MAFDLGSIFAEIGVNTAKLDAGLMKAELKLGNFDKSINSVGQKLTAASTKMMIAGGLMAGSVLAVGVAAVKMAATFETSMRNVNSISKLSESEFKALGESVIGISKKFPQTAKELADGLYDIASSGFQGADGLKILEASAMAASAGMTTTAVSAKGITAVLNAYGLEASDAAGISDTMFRTVDRGVITFEELSSTVGDWVGIGKAAGISFNEMSGAIAYMTTKGINASEAGTSLNRLITEMVKPVGEMADMWKAAGYESGEAAIKQLGLAGAMQVVNEKTKGGLTATQLLVPEMRGARGALALLGNGYEELTTFMEGFVDTSGSAAIALAEQSKSLEFQLKLLKNSATAIGIEIGNRLIPSITKYVTAADGMTTANTELIASNIILAGKIGGAVAGILLAGAAYGKITLFAQGLYRVLIPLAAAAGLTVSELVAAAVALPVVAKGLNNVTMEVVDNTKAHKDWYQIITDLVGIITLSPVALNKSTMSLFEQKKAVVALKDPMKGYYEQMHTNTFATTEAKMAIQDHANAVIALAAQYPGLTAAEVEAQVTADELAASTGGATQSLEDLRKAFISGAMSPGIYISMLNKLGLTLEQLKAEFASVISTMFANYDMQSGLTAATKAYNESLAGTISGGGGSAKVAKSQYEIDKLLTQQKLAIEDATYKVADAQANLDKVMEGSVSTDHEKFDAQKQLTEANFDQVDATEKVALAQKNLDKVMAHGVSTIRDITEAQFDLSDANDAVATAQKNLDKIMAHGKSTARDITEANFDLTDANYSYVDAQTEYDRVMADSTSTERDKYEAQKKLTEANFSQIDAQEALNTITAESVSTDKEKKDAQEELTKAQFEQTDAQDKLKKVTDESISTDKEKLDAQEALITAQLNLTDANFKVIDSQENLNAVMEGVSATEEEIFNAQMALTEAMFALTDAQNALNKSTETGTGGGAGTVKTLDDERLAYEALAVEMLNTYNALDAVTFKTDEQKAQIKALQEEWVTLGIREMENGVISGEEFAKKSTAFGISAKDIISFAEGMNIDVNRLLKDSSDKGIESFINLAQGFGLNGQAIIDKAGEIGYDIKGALQDAADKGAENFVALATNMGFSGSQIIKMAGDWGIALDAGLRKRLLEVDKTAADATIKIFVADLFAIKDKEVKLSIEQTSFRAAQGNISSFVTDLEKIQNRSVTITTTSISKAMGGIVGYANGGTVGMPTAASGMVVPQTGRAIPILAHEYEDIVNTSQQRNLAEWIMGKANSRPDGKGSGGNTFNIYPQTSIDFENPTNIRLIEQAVARALS